MQTTHPSRDAILVAGRRPSATDLTMGDKERQRRFEAILGEHRSLIGRVAEVYERNPADREDLIQEVIVALWRALPTFRGDSSLKTFIVRIAHNCAVSHLSRRRLSTEQLDEALEARDSGESPIDQVHAAGLRERLLAAMGQLPLGLRQAFALTLEGLSHAEAAEVLGITENNLTVRVSRARARLRVLLEDAS